MRFIAFLRVLCPPPLQPKQKHPRETRSCSSALPCFGLELAAPYILCCFMIGQIQQAKDLFLSSFGDSCTSDTPRYCASAPGRVNFIGEHTDYSKSQASRSIGILDYLSLTPLFHWHALFFFSCRFSGRIRSSFGHRLSNRLLRNGSCRLQVRSGRQAMPDRLHERDRCCGVRGQQRSVSIQVGSLGELRDGCGNPIPPQFGA